MPRLGLGATITNAIKIGSAAVAAVITSGLAMWHKFTASTVDGTPRLPDDSANTNEGSLYTGRGFSFDGVNDSINIGDVAALDFERTDAFSVSLYFKYSSASNVFFIGKMLNGGNYNGWAIRSATSKIIFELNAIVGSDNIRTTIDNVYNDDIWHYLVITYDGSSNASGVSTYIDGASVAHTVNFNNLISSTLSASTFCIGARDDAGIFFPGTLANIKIFNIELTSTQVTELYQNPEQILVTGATAANLVGWWPLMEGSGATAYDGSGNNNDGTISGATAVTKLPQPVTQSALLSSNYTTSVFYPEGTTASQDIQGVSISHANTGEIIMSGSEYIQVADDATLDITAAITLEAWVKPFSVASTQTIIGKTGAYALKIDSSGKPSFSRWSGASETATATTSTALSADTWYHIAVTYDSSNVNIYINGALDTGPVSVTGAIDTNTNNCIIGGLTTGTELFNGYIEDARIYNTDLSAANISNNYSVGRSTT